ncbi:MAG TPA: NAD(P)H-binding protein, partial [Cyclobacteriaceae bacterium]|nr:NAD(P)H-binding protein [Cyclobacteriaceae bacterium]
MAKHNIQRLVFISVYDIDPDFVKGQKSAKLADPKAEAEKLIRESGFNWTILGCPPSYELFFRLLRNNRLNVPGGGRQSLVCISPDDVGEIASQAIIRDDLKGMRFRLAGPETINFPGFAEKVSAITRKKVKYRAIPLGIVNIVTFILGLINPYPRMIYLAIRMMNNFPSHIAARAKEDHNLLIKTFHLRGTTLDEEIRKRFRVPE